MIINMIMMIIMIYTETTHFSAFFLLGDGSDDQPSKICGNPISRQRSSAVDVARRRFGWWISMIFWYEQIKSQDLLDMINTFEPGMNT